jgi:SpoVK/Ycf46/Vps4 family AAA+-type ATPase
LKALSSRLHLLDDVRLDEIALETEYYSGADLQAVLYTAQLKAVHQRTQGKEHKQSIWLNQLCCEEDDAWEKSLSSFGFFFWREEIQLNEYFMNTYNV